MWIIISVILGLIVLILLADNSLLRKENEALKYTNIYLSFKFKDDIDTKELERFTKKYK
ncbi:TPA: DUF1514 domain-containing protein [Staphylococcus pseudintermedius]|uniref:DUF1514 family protein n=1 Tax=Staphylococcus pseudintermedius TaxID=283734 RepID=UPI000C1B95B0|nr:DUF1514 family protein [Staphylococcus pseudintermedius]EGQ1685709.1 DUF1514 domain-containing protein [Staphylococcus pseudintermedius]EGQ2705422.1 DUF1514 domain-containing protein [Staphylococcus pseudintermedius]EGQ2875409.1 DUF1514 domain-containing protein [Staphylococcus pseudintermedius]EGQ3262071.1 DUF1514 domain-containing protein [Staphylococcus pseudintermedius]EGQ3323208.1 DUF1514 domain-containing protein [Staphylococcus pseudintermedius]